MYHMFWLTLASLAPPPVEIARVYFVIVILLYKRPHRGGKGDGLLLILMGLYFPLAWEPSVALVTHSYSRRLPALDRFYWENKFSKLKLIYSTKNFKTKLSQIPHSKFKLNRYRSSRFIIGQTSRHPDR